MAGLLTASGASSYSYVFAAIFGSAFYLQTMVDRKKSCTACKPAKTGSRAGYPYTWSIKVPQKIGTSTSVLRVMSHFLRHLKWGSGINLSSIHLRCLRISNAFSIHKPGSASRFFEVRVAGRGVAAEAAKIPPARM